MCNSYLILLVVSFPFSLCVRLIGEDGAASEDHFLSNWNLVVDEKLGGSISTSSAAAATHSAVVLMMIPHARPQKPASIDWLAAWRSLFNAAVEHSRWKDCATLNAAE